MEEYKKLADETEDEYIFRVCSRKDLIGSWGNVAEIINKELGKRLGESTYRKRFSKMQLNLSDERRIQIEKIKYRDERNAWNRQNYIVARQEDTLEKLEEAIRKIARVEFPKNNIVMQNTTDNTILILLSDTHFGQTFDSYWGSYNTRVARDRLGKLLDNIRAIQETHHAEACVVAVLGDCISGSIHKTIQVTNREDIIGQIKIATEMISSFCYELSQLFNDVKMFGVSGNHSRLTEKKENALHTERLDEIIYWGVDLSLKHIDNFTYLSCVNCDVGIAILPIYGKQYVFVHGDNDNFTKSGVQNLVTMLHIIPEAVLCGHRHVCALDDCNGIKMVQSGSLVGTGDQFTIEKRIYGKPSQMVCICNENGLEAFYPVALD